MFLTFTHSPPRLPPPVAVSRLPSCVSLCFFLFFLTVLHNFPGVRVGDPVFRCVLWYIFTVHGSHSFSGCVHVAVASFCLHLLRARRLHARGIFQLSLWFGGIFWKAFSSLVFVCESVRVCACSPPLALICFSWRLYKAGGCLIRKTNSLLPYQFSDATPTSVAIIISYIISPPLFSPAPPSQYFCGFMRQWSVDGSEESREETCDKVSCFIFKAAVMWSNGPSPADHLATALVILTSLAGRWVGAVWVPAQTS